MKRQKIKGVSFFGILAVLFLLPAGILAGQDPATNPEQTEQSTPASELDKLKMEWESVREQQVQMIREKEDQLEKLKEEIFSKMKTPVGPDASGSATELEVQKAAFQAERQKFFAEMSRQKESLRRLQTSLDEKTRQFRMERERFEQEKKMAAR